MGLIAVGTLLRSSSTPSSRFQDWNVFTDAAQGISFRYPASLATKYIHPVDWPPQASVSAQRLSCVEAGEPGARAGQTQRRSVSGREYCVTEIVGAAAGSVYTQYAYAFEKDSKTVILTFSLRAVQCANYDEAERIACESERSAFSPDSMVDGLVATLKLGPKN